MLKHNGVFSAQSAKILLLKHNYLNTVCTPCTGYDLAGVQALTCAGVRFAWPQREGCAVASPPGKPCAGTPADSQLEGAHRPGSSSSTYFAVSALGLIQTPLKQ